LTEIKASPAGFAYSYAVEFEEDSIMGEKIDPDLMTLAKWLIGGLVVVFILSIVLQ
jgi:preprotein translocase subunit Sec61beta